MCPENSKIPKFMNDIFDKLAYTDHGSLERNGLPNETLLYDEAFKRSLRLIDARVISDGFIFASSSSKFVVS